MTVTGILFKLLLVVCWHRSISATDISLIQTMFQTLNGLYFNDNVMDTPELLSEYDFIIIGAGSGGSVMANRLTEIASWNVLLIEVGDHETILTDVPLTSSLSQQSGFNWGYRSSPTENACRGLKNGVCNWPKGRALGGTSVVNYLLYVRGHRRDYDEWAAQGNTGWAYEDVLPYFKKSENMRILNLIDSPYHGCDGGLTIEEAGYESELFRPFVNAGRDLGYNETDPNGETMMGFSKAQATMHEGRRCSAAKAFIKPASIRRNLHISTKSWVTKILIDPKTKVAWGVEMVKRKKRFTIRIRREIILAAGVIASPQLLMLSGVGPRSDLEQLGIPVIQDLKVGYNLQDHACFPSLTFRVNESVSVTESQARQFQPIQDYWFGGRGVWTVPGGAEGLAFMKVPNSQLPNDYPDIELVMGVGSLNGDTSGSMRSLLGITDEFFNYVYGGIINKPAFGVTTVLLKPKSRGRVSLKSRNPFHWPKMEPGYNSDKEDMRTLVEGIKLSIKVMESKSFQHLNARLHDKPYLGCEHLEFRSDAYWECCIRQVGTSLQHQSGTCKMGPNSDPDAVVSPTLEVYGIKSLRVVDASIIPSIPASHTNAVVIMIGEKAADLVKDYWLKNSDS